MIIDKILDRYDGDAYDPEDFYRAMMSYEEGTDFPISRALDSGEEEDIKRELCAYIDDGNYNPKIKDFINSVKWLEADDGKDYSKEFDILGESKFKCSMAKKKESLGKKNEEAVPFNATEFPKELKQMYNACSKEFYCESELSSAVDVSSGKDGVSSAHYVLRGEYGSYAKLKVVFDYDKEDGFTITILGLDETVGYDWVELGSGKSSSFKEALTTALNEFGKNIMSLVSKIRKATGKSESKKNESVYGTVRVDSEDIAIKVQESNVYPSSSGRSLSGDVPKVESWFSTLSEFSDCIDGMAEDCNGYPDISRDGSDILVKINAPMEDENGEFNGDYEVIVELRCSTEITNGSLDGVVDLLNHE